MFSLFKNKEKNLEKVNWYKQAIKMIKFFMATYDWEKAKDAIEEIKEKELRWYNELIENLNTQDDELLIWKEKNRQNKIYEEKVQELNALENKLEKLKINYEEQREKDRFKVRFTNIKKELNILIRKNKGEAAINLLNQFLDENKNKEIVIKFYNKEKKYILKNLKKFKKVEDDKLKQNAKLEAMKLIWENVNLDNENSDENNKKNIWFFKKLKNKINFYKTFKEKLRKKKLLDEISLLIEEDSKVKNDIATQKLVNIHKWLIKEISQNNMIWYHFYGKILWADKISGDAFWFNEEKNKYNFFIWDATWHGIRAWFIITLLSRLFNESVNKSLQELIYQVNNGLKQDLKSRNFITGIFFEIEKKNIHKIKYVGMGHEPMLIYKAKDRKIEKLIPGWLAAWIRIINNPEQIKVKEIDLDNWDIVLSFSDWIAEAKSEEWIFYWIDRLIKAFEQIASTWAPLNSIYEHILNDVKYFKWWSNFVDDVTLLLLKRDIERDIIDKNSEYLKELTLKWKISQRDVKKIVWKTKDHIEKEVEKIAKDKKIKSIIKSLETLYYTWEILKLKQEAIRFIKDWYIDAKINHYLKKAIENEEKYKIEQKSQRVRNKYNVLKELLKKWDYMTVIRETEDIIAKDWNI